jgi:hypothetical protein
VELHERTIVLASGEARDVIIDASGAAPCTVIVHLLRDGKPVEGLSIWVGVRSQFKPGGWRSSRLGTTGADGTVQGEIDGDIVFDLDVESATNEPLGQICRDVAASPGARIERTYEIEAGRVVVELPATLAIPAAGLVSLSLQAPGQELHFSTAATPDAPQTYRNALAWTSNTIAFGEFARGQYDATIRVQRLEPDPARPKRMNPVDLREPFTTKVTIETGRETKLVVP